MKILLPPYGRRYFGGSSEGWLACIDRKLAVTLYKPLMVKEGKSDEIISLPPLVPPTEEVIVDDRRYLGDYIFKITTFTFNPIANSNDLICVAIFGGFRQLAYIRPIKDTTWTFVTCMEQVMFDDVVYYNNQFYALTSTGVLACFNFKNPNLKLVASEISRDVDEDLDYCHKKYLVEYGGELLQIQRYVTNTGDDFDPKTTRFKVFELFSEGWLEIDSLLGDAALFIGDNSSISVLASNFVGCQRNCIYFTQDKKNTLYVGELGPRDLGVYNLEKGSLSPRFTINDTIFPKLQRRAIWIVPPFNIF